jgi:hypothetical protein
MPCISEGRIQCREKVVFISAASASPLHSLLQALDIAHQSFHQHGAEEQRWQALVASNSLLCLVQHARGDLNAATTSADVAQVPQLLQNANCVEFALEGHCIAWLHQQAKYMLCLPCRTSHLCKTCYQSVWRRRSQTTQTRGAPTWARSGMQQYPVRCSALVPCGWPW